MATELFRVPLADPTKPDFTISEEQLAGYNPSAWFTSTELLDTVAITAKEWTTTS